MAVSVIGPVLALALLGAGIEGEWEGKEVIAGEVRFPAVAFSGASGSLVYEGDAGKLTLPFHSLEVRGDEVLFAIRIRGSVRRYRGTWSGDRIQGTITAGDAPQPIGSFELTRATARRPTHLPPSKTVPSNAPQPARPAAMETDTGLARQEGEARLMQAMDSLAGKAGTLVTLVRRYRAECQSLRPVCDVLYSQIGALAVSVGHGLDTAIEDARRAGVAPGVVRDARKQYGLDHQAWDQLSAEVRRLEEEARQRSKR